jgi:membrane protease YdiL (CAAX protease family)
LAADAPGGPSRLATVAWSVAFLVLGYFTTVVLSQAAVSVLVAVVPALRGSVAGMALVQAGVGIGVFGALSFAVGRRLLRLRPAELGWSSRRPGVAGFGRGLVLGAAVGGAALVLGVAAGLARWSAAEAGFGAYLGRLPLLAAMLLPPAFMEELAFRGVGLAGLTRALGPGAGILITSLLFALVHRLNPAVTPLALGNIALAGIFLALTFFAPGGLWTATGAHLGWNLALAGLGAPVSGLPFDLEWLTYSAGEPGWITGGAFGPEGGLLATAALAAGIAVAARWRNLKETI